MMKNKFFIRTICLLITLLFFSCTQDDHAPPPAVPDNQEISPSLPRDVDVIRLEGGDWGYPTPFAHYPRGPGGFKMGLIFDSLLERDENGLIPWLAEKYEILENGKVYIFTIRKEVKWQDGTPLTNEDVCFSIDYADRHPMTWSYIFDLIEHIETGPGHTVKVTLKKPAAPMLYNLGLTRIIPRHIWKKVDIPKEFTSAEAVIGSGPYRLQEYSKEHGTYRFEAFDGFWGPRRRVKHIEFIPVSEPILAYENKEIDLVTITPDLLPRFAKNTVHKIVKSPAFWGYRLLFNMKKATLMRDKHLRQAFAHAIDLNELVAKIARGAAIPGRAGILPPDHVMAAENVKIYKYDPLRAETLLAEAGFEQINESGVRIKPDKSALTFDLLCSSQEVRMAEVLKQRLAVVGIQIKIKSVDGKSRDTLVRNHDYQLAIIGHGGWGKDPEYITTHFCNDFSTLTSSPSASGIADFEIPELTDLLIRQQTETDPLKRRMLIEKIQHLAAEEVPEIPLFYTTGFNAYRPDKYNGWMFMFDHHSLSHGKLSYLDRERP